MCSAGSKVLSPHEVESERLQTCLRGILMQTGSRAAVPKIEGIGCFSLKAVLH